MGGDDAAIGAQVHSTSSVGVSDSGGIRVADKIANAAASVVCSTCRVSKPRTAFTAFNLTKKPEYVPLTVSHRTLQEYDFVVDWTAFFSSASSFVLFILCKLVFAVTFSHVAHFGRLCSNMNSIIAWNFLSLFLYMTPYLSSNAFILTLIPPVYFCFHVESCCDW